MKTYLALDLGSKSLGLAISTSGIIAQTLATLYFKEDDYQEAAQKMLEVIKKEKIDVLVIGLPKHMNNDLGKRGQISYELKEILEEKTSIDIVLWDERLSTKTALKALSAQKQTAKVRKGKKDELAAVVILQNYLDYKGANK